MNHRGHAPGSVGDRHSLWVLPLGFAFALAFALAFAFAFAFPGLEGKCQADWSR